MSRFSPQVEPGYYGPDPSKVFADAIAENRQGKMDKRQQALDAENEQDRQRKIARENDLDPIQHALLVGQLIKEGILPPGSSAGQPEPAASSPNGVMAPGGGTVNAVAPSPDSARFSASIMDPGFGRPPVTSPMDRINPDPGFEAPMGMGGSHETPDAMFHGAPAHTLPGAFNVITNSHNPADIDLGGGYRMPYSATPAGRQASSTEGLQGFGFTQQEAQYLAQHPEHIAPFLAHRDAARNDPYGQAAKDFLQFRMNLQHQNDMDRLKYTRAHPAGQPREPKNEMTLAGALQQIDQMYGGPLNQAGHLTSRLNPAARMRLAQRMTKPDFDPSELGSAEGFGGTPGQGARGPDGAAPKTHITRDQAKFLKTQGVTQDQLDEGAIVDPN